MDIGKAFAFLGEDEDWAKKLLVGAILGAIPIVNFAVFGYQIQIARNVANDEERPLPTWDDFGSYLVDGLRMMVPMMLFLLPIICAYAAMIVGFIFVAEADSSAFGSSYGSSGPPPEIFGMIFLVFACILPYSLLSYFIMPMFGIQIARKGTVASTFQVGEMWELFRNQLGNYILIVIVMFGLYMASAFLIMPLSIVLSFIPCIGTILSMLLSGLVVALTMIVTGHLQGQFIKASETPKEFDDYSDIVSFDG